MTELYIDIDPTQWPIIYRPEYNIKFFKLERLHPFDSTKWGNIFEYLQKYGLLTDKTVVVPKEATKNDLLVVHPKKYLRKLMCSMYVAQVLEIPAIIFVPNCLVQRFVLKPMRYQTGGTILAGKLALERGWSINIGGGFHHCSANRGAGFCAYADITLLIQYLFEYYPDKVKTVMIIDLDAHQGNGYERDFKRDKRVFILDIYNCEIYPSDSRAKEAIDIKVELESFIEDEDYLDIVDVNLTKAFKQCKPDIIVYNAGSDILHGDSLGYMSISAEGIVKRDEIVFQYARIRKIPITMLMSGGYVTKSANIMGKSIINLHLNGLIRGPMDRY